MQIDWTLQSELHATDSVQSQLPQIPICNPSPLTEQFWNLKLIVTWPPSLTKAHQAVLCGPPPWGHIGLQPVGLLYLRLEQEYPFNSSSEHNTLASTQLSAHGGVHWAIDFWCNRKKICNKCIIQSMF